MKNPTEELTRHILLALVVGYFADAQYDVKAQVGYFACTRYNVKSPIVGVADTSPEGGSEINCVIAREQSDRGNPSE